MSDPADSSLRFILPSESAYLANLAALWASDCKLAAAVEATDSQQSYPCEVSQSGLPTVAAPDALGRMGYLHSKYEPFREAESLVESAGPEQNVAFFIHGMGLGYHLEVLFDWASEEAIFCIFEPDLLLLRTAFEQRDLSRILTSNRVFFFTKLDKSDLFVRLSQHNGLLAVGSASVSHPPSVQRAPEFHRQMKTWIGEFEDFSRTGLNTLILNGRRTAENITRNLGWYIATPSLARLKDRFKGSPAIIVSAGPSLRKNKHLLKDAAGKAVLIAVQTTLQPLLEMGIEPQFVTSLDYHEICTRFFEKLPEKLGTELIAEPKATDRIFKLNPGPLTLLGNDYAESLLHEMKVDKGRLPAGATVAHLAFYVAEHLGCDPIIFVGQDLGFSDGLCYTPGTSYEDVWRPELSEFCTVEMKQWEQIVRDRPILRQIPDHLGRPMYTEERLFTYLQQFERDFARSKARIIDATEGGAQKRGAASMTLAMAIEQFCTMPLPEIGCHRSRYSETCASSATQEHRSRSTATCGTRDHPGLQWGRIEESVRCLENRRAEASQIEQISRQTLPLLEEVRDHLSDQGRVNRLIARIDALRGRMDALGRCYDLITPLTQSTEMKRFESDRRLVASKALGTDKQRRQVDRDVENVRAVIAAAVEFQSLLLEVIDKLCAEHSVKPAASRKEAA